MTDIALYLASRSPRRGELLRQLGLTYARLAADLDETPVPREDPKVYVERMALGKARCGRLEATTEHPVIGADTAVVCDGRILGKPLDGEEALAMLQLLSGREHQVLTGVAVIGTRERTSISESLVRLRRIEPAEAAAYWS
ncbi:MAG: Maf family protein, partial [Thiohalocapsa sp.]